jgi:hypothetical protein
MMHEIEVWRKKSRTKRFGNSPRLRPGTTIIQQNNLLMLKKNKGNESVFFSRLKWSITSLCDVLARCCTTVIFSTLKNKSKMSICGPAMTAYGSLDPINKKS